MYNVFLNKYKSKEAIDIAIDEFKAVKSDDYSIIKSSYFRIFPIYPIPAIPIDAELLERDLSIYRTRPISSDIDDSLKDSFSYPKNSDYSKTQRANWVGRNVFYASDSLYTSLAETKLVYNKKEFYVSKWGFDFQATDLKKIQLVPLAFGQLSDKNPWKSILNSELNLTKHLLKSNTKEDAEIIYHFFIKIGEVFSDRNEDYYSLSAFFADQILYHEKSLNNGITYFPILIYPSITNDHNSCNFAIFPFFVDKYMKLEKVFKITISDIFSNRLLINYNQMGVTKSKIELEWYRMDYEKEKSYYQFSSISCQCGKIFDLKEVDNFVFKKGEKEYRHQEIMRELTKEIDLIEDLDESIIVEEKEILGGLMADYRCNTNDIELEAVEDEENHKQLTFEFKFITPFTYEKINSL